MMAGVGDWFAPLVYVWTGMMDTGLGRGFSVIWVAGTMVNLSGNAGGVSFGTLREGAGKSCWKATVGVGRGAMGAGSVGGILVTFDKIQESVWMAVN